MEESTQKYIEKQIEAKEFLVKSIAENLIGNDAMIDGPFESHKQTYADYAASGKAVKFIEDYIDREVLPVYSNTHTSSSFVGIQSSCFREEARGVIRDTYHCTDNDVILFSGNGCTGAVNTFVRILGLEHKRIAYGLSQPLLQCKFPGCPLSFNDPGDLRLHQRTHTDGDASSWSTDISTSTGHVVQPVSDDSNRPIVFVGPFEHHSNILPWREADVDFAQIGVNDNGSLDLEDLERRLQQFKNRPLRIVSLNHVSNVTGLITPMSPVNILAHKEGALICWDCATAGTHEAPLMNNTSVNAQDYADALFFSPHKMVGGVGCPGLLILKKKLLLNEVPSTTGGGTVFYVSETLHRYTQVLTEREEGGTPNIIGAIRYGLALHLHNNLGWQWIQQREMMYMQQTLEVLRQHPNIVILGDDNDCPKASVFSILIKHHGRYLHWNFVSMLLSDLFGIQTRSGCMCAGPYSMRLLGIEGRKIKDVDTILLDKNEIFRPGYTRISTFSDYPMISIKTSHTIGLSYVMTPEEVKFIQDALVFVSEEGWKFLPEYVFFEDTGEWRHKSMKNKKPFRRWLNDVSFTDGQFSYPPKAHEVKDFQLSSEYLTALFTSYLDQARATLARTEKQMLAPTYVVSEYAAGNVKHDNSPLADSYRWYVTRNEAYQDFKAKYTPSKNEAVLPSVMIQVHQRVDENENENENDAMMMMVEEGEEEKGMVSGSGSVKRASPTDGATEGEMSNGDAVSSSASSSMTTSTTETTPCTASNPFAVKISSKKIKREGCMLSSTGKEVTPLSVVSMVQEPGVEFKYHTGVDGSLEFTAIVPGMEFKERVKFMKKNKDLFPDVPTRLMKLMGQAVGHYEMIKQGDKVMLGLSGGKDSLTMLHCLLQLQRRSPIKFELACVTVDPQTTGFDPSPLRDYCKSVGVKYFYESRAVIALAKKKLQNGSICSWCSRMKRGILYSAIRREGYNVLVLAQHLDDLAESFLMSVFHNGVLRTMKACYLNKEKDIRVIRPFVYIREKQLREFAKTMNLPIIDENCPACFEGPKERYRMKTLLAAEENLFPNVFNCILSAIIPLMQHNSAEGCAMQYVIEEFYVLNGKATRNTPREMRGKLHNMLKERGIHYDPKENGEEVFDEDDDEGYEMME